jgi:uncharacterized membrane protein
VLKAQSLLVHDIVRRPKATASNVRTQVRIRFPAGELRGTIHPVRPECAASEGASMNAVVDIVKRTVSGARERGAEDMRGPSGINVNQVERAVSMLLGGMLVASGIKRRSVGGAVVALAGGGLLARGVTGHSTLYQKLGLHTEGGRKIARTRPGRDELDIVRAITIGKPVDELYRTWRDPNVLSQLLGDYGSITWKDEKHLHWRVHGPLDRPIEWDTEVEEVRPGQMLRWSTPAGAKLPCEGSAEFRPAPGNRGTEVVLRMKFSPPLRLPGDTVMDLLGFVPKQMALKALWRFKALCETGEIPTIKLQPACRNDGRDR